MKEKRVLGNDELTRCVIIDFETPGRSMRDPGRDPWPVLLGVRAGHEWRQYLLDEDFTGIAAYTSKGSEGNWPCLVNQLGEVAHLVLEIAEQKVSPIVGFTFFDRDVFSLAGRRVHGLIAERYVDARATLEFGLSQDLWQSGRRGHRTLDWYRTMYGLSPLPRHLRGRKVGGWIGEVREELRRPSNAGYFGSGPSSSGKRKWTQLKMRNRRDCDDLHELLHRATDPAT